MRVPIAPYYAAILDRKLDNGLPNSGSMIADYGTQTDNCKTSAPEAYNITSDTSDCILFFKFF